MSVLGWFRGVPPAARIAPLETEHAPDLARVHAAGFTRPWDAHEFERLLADRAVVADGLFLTGRPLVGFALSRVVLDEAEILSVALAPEARGRGYSRPLLGAHLEALARAAVRVVHLEVEEGNGPAIALYRRLSFQEVGRREGYYLKPDGVRAAALSMRLVL